MTNDPEAIAARLSDKQKAALLAFPDPYHFNTVMDGDVLCVPECTAGELGVSGNTLMSMYGLGGVDQDTLLLGPILVSCEWGQSGKRYWQCSDLGLRVRESLTEQDGNT